ncbi:MAG: hypothetical protein ACRC0Y_07630 [Fusobacteriaceae bacterium]
MEKVYITNSNLKIFLEAFKIHKIDYQFIIEQIGEDFDSGFLFSDYEKKMILFKKNMILESQNFYKKNEEIFNNESLYDNYSYQLYNSHPAYHKDNDCLNLKNHYENYMIDKNLPQSLLKEYKIWLEINKNMFHIDFGTFNLIHKKKWGEEIKNPEYISATRFVMKSYDILKIA